MPVVRWKSVLVLAVLLAAATAVADPVITAKEVISCRVVSADTNFVRLKLPTDGIRMLYTHDVYEIRLSDSSRVAALSTRLPQLRVVPDAGQPVPAPAVRAREPLPLREDLTRCPTVRAGFLDTLFPATTPENMMAMCREMDILLRKYERNDTAAVSLLREVGNEQAALGGIWPDERTRLLPGAGGILGMAAGTWLGWTKGPPRCAPPLPYVVLGTEMPACGYTPATCVIGAAPVGCLVGSVLGYALGAGIGASLREGSLKGHRNRVNELVHRVNHVISSQL
jgi:hypothetical protein